MNTKNLTSECDELEEQIPDNKRAAKNTNEQLKESFHELTFEVDQAPVFNIHVHVPADFEGQSTKLYLPQIQPIIHVHFDEHEEVLKNNASLQEGGLTEQNLQNMIAQKMPKFGNVILHFKNNSFSRHFNDINKHNQNQVPSEKNFRIELESERSDKIENMPKQHAHITNQGGNINSNAKTRRKTHDELSNIVLSNGHPIKLKKAVVVLKDICKSNSYKSGVISDLLNLQRNKSANSSPSSTPNGVTESYQEIKIEHTSSSPTAHSSQESEKPYADDDNSCKQMLSDMSSNSTNLKSPGEGRSTKRESLISLIEGCNFSEILRRFKEKHKRYISDYLEKPNIVAEDGSMEEDDKGSMDDKIWLMQNNTNMQKEIFQVEQSHNEEEEKHEQHFETCEDIIDSYEIKHQYSLNSTESSVENLGTCGLSNSGKPSVEGANNIVNPMNGAYRNKCSINLSHVAETESVIDNDEFATRPKLSSVVEELKTVEFDSSNTMIDVIKLEFDAEANDVILDNKEDENFDFKVMEKEMVSPRKQEAKKKVFNYEKRKSSESYENESSSKKNKRSLETPKKSVKEAPMLSSMGEGYIPLNIPGPTEFAVATSSEAQKCKPHDAKNFKKDMLFGKRVNRFSSPDHLRMYKLKRQAAGRCD